MGEEGPYGGSEGLFEEDGEELTEIGLGGGLEGGVGRIVTELVGEGEEGPKGGGDWRWYEGERGACSVGDWRW